MRRLQVVIVASPLFFAATSAKGPDPLTRGRVALERMRAALGGEGRLSGIRTLILSGTLKRHTDTEDVTGSIRLEFLLPSHFQKIRSEGVAGATIPMVRSWGFDGRMSWSAFNGRPTQDVEDSEAEFVRLLLLLTGLGPTADAIVARYAGEAKAPDGTADVVDASGPRIGSARLFIDTETGRPLMLTYEGRLLPSGVTVTFGEGGRVRSVADKRKVSENALIEIRPADYREAGGVLLPHSLSISVGGELIEEWEVAYKVNPLLKPEHFKP